jgi:hypothetical protein
MKETYFNEKLEKVSFRRRKDSLLYSRLYSFNVYFIYHTHLYVLGARVAQWVRSLDLTTHTSPSPIRRGLVPSFVNYKKGTLRLAAASDKVYQLLVQGRWFSPGTPASFITKTGRHDISEILLKVALSTKIRILYMFCNIYEWLNELDRWIYATHTSLSPIRRGFAPGFVNY